jgi:hypothetical protein
MHVVVLPKRLMEIHGILASDRQQTFEPSLACGSALHVLQAP